MTRKSWLKTTGSVMGVVAMLSNPLAALAATTPQTSTLTTAQKVAMLQSKVKYVFVIFHENESFDHFFGTFPGANGLFAAPAGATPANATPSFTQRALNPFGAGTANPGGTAATSGTTITPFLMPQAVVTTSAGAAGPAGTVVPVYPADLLSVDHSHQGMANDLDVTGGIAANDRYAMNQEGLTTSGGNLVLGTGSSAGTPPTTISLAQKQAAEVDLSHIDCDTIPFMWAWASRFALFDNFRQTIIGPSTPNAIAIIAGQSGQTQQALHPAEAPAVSHANNFQNVKAAAFTPQNPATTNGVVDTNGFVPVIADPGPFPGSNRDPNAVKPPYNFDENINNPALNLTFATLPLSFMGSNIGSVIQNDQSPQADLADVRHDIFAIAANNQPVSWGWFQQGFNGNDAPDPFEPQSTGTGGVGTVTPSSYTGYVLHHNGPEYFGYLADNTEVLNNNLHGSNDFLAAVNNKTLPAGGGVFYLRGGYDNNDGLVPVDPTPGIQHAFLGNDDHPSYSDHQISEAFAARAIEAIANSPYWSESAIVITYDETDGFYDHVSPTQRNTLVDGSILAGGPRIPTIVISPYALAGTISHQYSEHGSLIKFIDELFNLVPLASLPDEKHATALAQSPPISQTNYGPSDDPANNLGDLTEAFDYDILAGSKPAIPASAAIFTAAQRNTLPQLAGTSSPNGYTNGACAAIGILPTDYASQAAYAAGRPSDPYPVDVNPRPSASPGTPTSGNWTP